MMDSHGSLQGPDYAMIAGYFILMLGIGVYFYRHMRGIKDYFSGGNNIPWWLSGVSFYMSSFSAFAFISYSSLCYRFGWVGITLLWVAIPATLFSTLFLARKWRRARIDSPLEYLEIRYSGALRQLFTWQGVPVKIIDDALKLVAIGFVLNGVTGIDMTVSMLFAGGIMLLYTFMGGLWAVAVTDFVQFVVLTVAIVIMFPLAFHRAGGFMATMNDMPEGFLKLTSPEYGWYYVIFLVVMYSLAWSSINWSLIQRYYCVPRERDAIKVGLTVIVLYIIGPPLMFLPAMAASRILPPDILATLAVDAGGVYPALCRELLPAGMLGLVVAAMFAATMSMLSSDYNVSANVLTNDVYRRLLRPTASNRELVLVGRAATLLVGILAMAAALIMAQGKGEQLFNKMVSLFSVATAPVAIPMILGLLSKHFTARSALWGFLAGFTVGLTLFAFSQLAIAPYEFYRFQWIPTSSEFAVFDFKIKIDDMTIFISAATVTLIVMILKTIQLPMRLTEKENVYSFFDKLTIPIGMLPEDRQQAASVTPVSPFLIVGISLAAIGVMMIAILPWLNDWFTRGLNGGIALLLLIVGLLMAWPRQTGSMPEEEATQL
jgi:solute:Na+ symporter, SSS family